MTVIVGLGILSLMNIVATIVTPLLANATGDDDEAEADPAKARRYQRNLAFLTDNVLNAIEAFSNKQ